MKLGIVVVYLFNDERSAKLLDLHLKQIEKHTRVPYVIYGSVNRLEAGFRERLAQYPQVRVYELPKTDLRGGKEHSYYLDRLVSIAIEDGASHIVTLHLDSFPVRLGWAEELAGRLSDSCALATLERINTACLFFGRDFYVQYRPPFMVPEAARANPLYRQYLKEHNPFQHSGTGYGFMAYSRGLSCSYLRETAGGPQGYGRIYDGMIFHLRAAVRVGEEPPAAKGLLSRPAYRRLMDRVAFVSRAILPVAVRRFLRDHSPRLVSRLVDRPRRVEQAQQIMRLEEQLLEDPEAYLGLLVEGKQPREP